MRSLRMASAIAAALAFGTVLRTASAQHEHEGHEHDQGKQEHREEAGHSHEKAEVHGGVATMSKQFHVETVFMPDQIRLYLYDGKQNPMHVKHWKKGLVEATGTVDFRDRSRGTESLTFEHAVVGSYACCGKQSSKPGKCPGCGMKLTKEEIPDGTLWACPMHPDENGKSQGSCSDCGMKFTPQDYLVAHVDLKDLKPGAARATFHLMNLSDEKEPMLQFTQKFVPAKMHQEHEEGKHDKQEKGHDEHGHDDHGH